MREGEPRGQGIDRLIQWSIMHRGLVVFSAALVLAAGVLTALRMPVDVFPDLAAPTVTVVTEAHGLAPEEVERDVTALVESAVANAGGIERVRSRSSIGLSLVWVEFEWGTDVYRARQIVAEKLQLVRTELPKEVGQPTLAPIASIMGEILFLGLVGDGATPEVLRNAADDLVKKRLLAVPGVAHVLTIGGALKEIQIVLDPRKLASHQLSTDDVFAALDHMSENTSGGVLVREREELVIRGLGQISSAAQLGALPVAVRGDATVRVSDIASIDVGRVLARGEGSVNGAPAVVVGVLKQPGTNTVFLTEEVDRALSDVEGALPSGVRLERELLRQADFIESAIDNVARALRDGAILVAVILFVFLWNWRTTVISLVALPLSLAVAVLVLECVGATINTMTLGGLTIAIGALVDDAIIDVENVFRRLRENASLEVSEREPPRRVVWRASCEIRGAITFATCVVGLVYVPLFFMAGVGGRLLVPLGFAYLVALFASLFVALTVTPALCSYMLPRGAESQPEESRLVALLKVLYRPWLAFSLRRPWVVFAVAGAMLLGSVALVPRMGRTFLPDFHEGALTISAVAPPGTSLAASNELGSAIEKALLTVPEVVKTSRRTGRSELDEHAQGVNASEIDARLSTSARSKTQIFNNVREVLAPFENVTFYLGQPISHRIDHILSGTPARIAIKIFGEDAKELSRVARAVRDVARTVPGAVDVDIEQEAQVPQLQIRVAHDRAAAHGLSPGAVAEAVELAFAGRRVGKLQEGARSTPIVVRYRSAAAESAGQVAATEVAFHGRSVALADVADISEGTGPEHAVREDGARLAVVVANAKTGDLSQVVERIRAAVRNNVRMDEKTYVVYGGQYESAQAARERMMVFAALVALAIFALLLLACRSLKLAVLLMVNLPLAFIGGILAIFFTDKLISLGSLVGFITLFGIATRNGLMLVSHYEALRRGGSLNSTELVMQGSLERLSPVLMTALSAVLALVPLVLAGALPGNEIQAPMAAVILGGLLLSTGLNMLVVPALYFRFGLREQAAPTLAPP